MKFSGTDLIAVAAGSALGAVLRTFIGFVLLVSLSPLFPWATLIVNVLGSFLIALYARVTGSGGCLPVRPQTQLFVITGFCGGFTTLSIFSLEAVELLLTGHGGLAALYVAASLLLWLLAAWIGFVLGGQLNRLRPA